MRLNKRKKKLELKYVYLIIILGVCLVIGIISLTTRDDRELTFIEKGLKDIGVSTQKILYTPVRFVINKINNYGEMKRVYNKYKDVDKFESKVPLLESENKELKRSLDELKDILDLNTLVTDYEAVNATVINRDIGNWYNMLTIDKGEKDGLKKDMIIITNKGLIGKIIKTTYLSSDVKLITTSDLNNKISVGVITDENTTYGLLSGYNHLNKQLLVTDIVDGETIKVGDKVTTSGLSNVFPKGIIVGTVSKVELDEFGISKNVSVTPQADFNNLTYVTVVKGHH